MLHYSRSRAMTTTTAAFSAASKRLRELADLLEQQQGITMDSVVASLQSVAQELLSKPASESTVEALERNYATAPAEQPINQLIVPTGTQPQAKKQRRVQKVFDFAKYSQRYVALHLMYVGWSYQGFARQADSENTIEGCLFPALRRVKLIPEDGKIADLSYSRCGRTDKGVSALGQVLALKLRSNALADEPLPAAGLELDYPTLINRALPDTIRVLGWADVAEDFNARFSAVAREYKYFIVQDGHLDLAAMQAAAQQFIGEHDFRNFCKADVAQVHNFKRVVVSATIEPQAVSCPGMTIVALCIKGTAFLWHQVRCIAAVLLMVGRGLEKSSIISKLLDVSTVPCKPQYSMAAEEPLLLYSCGFNNLVWRRNQSQLGRILATVAGQLQHHLIAAALTSSIYEQLQNYYAAGAGDMVAMPQQTVADNSVAQWRQQQQQQQQSQPSSNGRQQLHHQQSQTASGECHNALMAAAPNGNLSEQQQQQQGEVALVQQQQAVSQQERRQQQQQRSNRWLAPDPPHNSLLKRATEPSIEERFEKAGIPLDLLNQPGLARGMDCS